jgi:hypothetical protein
MAAGLIIGKAYDWLQSRNNNQPIQNPSQDRVAGEIASGVDWDPYSGIDTSYGPPAEQQGQAPAWSDNTTTNADDPMGLVPDYGQDGPPPAEDATPQHGYAHGEKGFQMATQFSPGQMVYTGHSDQWYNGPKKRSGR